jgi:regulatory protein
MRSDEASAADIRLSAMNLLAMREHSVKELKDKLARKYSQSELIEEVIVKLIEQGLQSDERFAQAFIGMRQRQGKGSVLIKMELRERGILPSVVNSLIDETDALWAELAREVRSKRFHTRCDGAKEKAKQMRFLHSRGFASRHIQAAFTDNYEND